MTNRQRFLNNPTDDTLDEICRLADVTPWSVLRRLANLPVKGRVGLRIDKVLEMEAA